MAQSDMTEPAMQARQCRPVWMDDITVLQQGLCDFLVRLRGNHTQ
jgi:hypothetical protein